MKRLTLGALRRIRKFPERVKPFFRQPECRYAYMGRWFQNVSISVSDFPGPALTLGKMAEAR